MYISISYRYYYILIRYSDICIFRLGVYEVNCVPCYILFLCWEWGRWVVYLVSVYLVLFWFVYTEIPRVFWALGILFIYLLCWEWDTRSSGF